MTGRHLTLDDYAGGSRGVLVAMSGGVDSSVAALLLVRAGFDVIGVTMKNFCYGEREVGDRSCCSLEAIDDARAVCAQLGIRHIVVDVEEIFRKEVMENFVEEYRRGRTPNPCVRCNERVRFRKLVELGDRYGMRYVATGHYARLFASSRGKLYLSRAVSAKDQSYFLALLDRELLMRTIFPLGAMEKEAARRFAAEAGLPVADKPDSQEVCFIPDGDVRSFLSGWMEFEPGPVVDPSGAMLGEHAGLGSFTIGQRRHTGVAGGEPLYVVDMDIRRNALVVGTERELMRRELRCTLGWSDEEFADLAGEGLEAKIRSRHTPAPVAGIEVEGKSALVRFETPQKAIAPGQTIAFYTGDLVVGAGTIDGHPGGKGRNG